MTWSRAFSPVDHMADPNRLLVFMETHTRVFTLGIWAVRYPPNLGLTSGSSMTLTLQARLDERRRESWI
jgi:hypothetical protein